MKSILLILCSNGMRPFYLISNAIVIVMIASVLFATLLLFRAAPPNETLPRYRFGVRIRLILPFSKRWQNEVSLEHIETFRKFRKRLFAWGFALFGCILLRLMYINMLAPRVVFMFASNQCGK